MQVHTDIDHLSFPHKTIVTIGTFDGVHLGHRKIIQRLIELKAQHGLPVVLLTFDPHPRKVLFPEQSDLKLLSSNREKESLLQDLQIDHLVVYPFTKAFSNLPADDYIKGILLSKLHAGILVIGYDHRFGHNREGNIETLVAYSKEHNFEVEEIPAQDIHNINVSSTKIRKALEEGQIEQANEFLGYTYRLSGIVEKGKQLGRTIGFPTANIRPESEDKLLPRIGVYFVAVKTGNFEGFGMMNIGINPTTDTDNRIKAEVNIFDFDKDIYGEVIEVAFLKRLRDEMKFESLEDLIYYIEQDELACMALIKTGNYSSGF